MPLVFSWCRRSGLQPQDTDDVVQEVFQAVNRSIADFRCTGPTDTFRGWLRTITKNKIRDHFRDRAGQPVAAGGTDAQQRFMDLAEDPPHASEEPSVLAGLVHRALGLIREEIEDRTWQAFWLTAVGQQSTVVVAQQLGMTPGAVRQAKYKVLRRLRQELGDVE
ncbi:MAG: sigma-70 family RNA polymerase sigma factor [Pirellulales bacterium]|nr:sigma-70 family RNA polymerase sigma factor [Pirellulales bacterium]